MLSLPLLLLLQRCQALAFDASRASLRTAPRAHARMTTILSATSKADALRAECETAMAQRNAIKCEMPLAAARVRILFLKDEYAANMARRAENSAKADQAIKLLRMKQDGLAALAMRAERAAQMASSMPVKQTSPADAVPAADVAQAAETPTTATPETGAESSDLGMPPPGFVWADGIF